MQIRKFSLKVLLLTSLVFSGIFKLNAKEFQVELVFFEHLNQSPSTESEPHVDYDPDSVPFLVNFNTVASEDLQLADEAQLIRGSRNFRLLKHVAWSQEGLSREEAGSVNISRWIPSLQGTITLYLNRYLHLDFHIESILDEPTNFESTGIDPTNLEFTGIDNRVNLLHERRRLRSKTTHYIDNPQFGVLARITALEDIAKMK